MEMFKAVSGKVRDIYDVSEQKLVIVTSDRISAFDVVLPVQVLGKGRLLNAISLFWFEYTRDLVPNHIISSNLDDMPEFFQKSEFEGRTVLVKKLKMLPFECVVRGYMFGNLWDEYSKSGTFCGSAVNGEYKLAQKLETPIFTPSTKAHSGHDEYVSYEDLEKSMGAELAKKLQDTSLAIYDKCYRYALQKGIIIADGKFEFGLDENNRLVLADELFTPDSSRFWSAADYKVGVSPKSFDKQVLRDWLLENRIDGQMQFSNVPNEILHKTAEIYTECLRVLTDEQ